MADHYSRVEYLKPRSFEARKVHGSVPYTWNVNNSQGSKAGHQIEAIAKCFGGTVSEHLVRQFARTSPVASSGFYAYLAKMSEYSQRRAVYFGDESSGQFYVAQSCGGIFVQGEYRGVLLNPLLHKEEGQAVLTQGEEYIFKVDEEGSQPYYIKAEVKPKEGEAKTTLLGTVTIEEKEHQVYRLNKAVLAQLAMEDYVLVSVASLDKGKVYEGHAVLVDYGDDKDTRVLKDSLPHLSMIRSDKEQVNVWYERVFLSVGEAFFQPWSDELLEKAERVAKSMLIDKIFLSFMIIATIVFETVSAIYKWRVEMFTPMAGTVSMPAWGLGLIVSGVIFMGYGIYRYCHPPYLDKVFQPKEVEPSGVMSSEWFSKSARAPGQYTPPVQGIDYSSSNGRRQFESVV